jgi:hypothetical protein
MRAAQDASSYFSSPYKISYNTKTIKKEKIIITIIKSKIKGSIVEESRRSRKKISLGLPPRCCRRSSKPGRRHASPLAHMIHDVNYYQENIM